MPRLNEQYSLIKISHEHLLKFFSWRSTGRYKDAVPEILTEE